MKIGFIGLGNVGAKLAGSILRNDMELCVRDLDPALAEPFLAQGATWADSPAEMACACDMIITCLPSPSACAAVMEGENGLLEGLSAGKLWAEMSTTDASEMARLAGKVIATGAEAIECPVSGGCHRAATGNISIFAGGSRKAFERALPVLTRLGRRVLHTGPIGTASTLKVLTNYLATTHLVALTEALTTMAAAGVDLGVTYEAIRISSGSSFTHETESQLILNGSRQIDFTLDLVLKDIGLFQKIADDKGVPLELSPKLIEIITAGADHLGMRAQSDEIIGRLEEATGLSVTAHGFPSELVDDEPEERGYEVEPAQ